MRREMKYELTSRDVTGVRRGAVLGTDLENLNIGLTSPKIVVRGCGVIVEFTGGLSTLIPLSGLMEYPLLLELC